MSFDLGKLFEDPTFMMGASLLGNNSPDAMTQAIAASQAMQRTKLAKQDKESERELEKARTELYRQQTETAKRRLDRDIASDEEWTNKTVPALMSQFGQQPGVQNAHQQPQPTASGSSLVPGSLGPGEIEPTATQRAVQREQETIAGLERELARAPNADSRMILTQELETAKKKFSLVGGLAQQQQQMAQINPIADPRIAARNAKLMGALAMGRDPAKRGEALGKFGEALEPKFATPGAYNLDTGQTIPDPKFAHQQEMDAATLGLKKNEDRRQESELQMRDREVRTMEERAKTQRAEEDRQAETQRIARTKTQSEDQKSFSNINANTDLLNKKATELSNHPGLEKIFGLQGKLPDYPGSDAANARVLHKSTVAQQARETLTAMRDASKTGGALGNVSDHDVHLLETAIVSLENSQSPKAAKDALTALQGHMNRLRDISATAYEKQYGKSPFDERAPLGSRATGETRGGKTVFRDPQGKKFTID